MFEKFENMPSSSRIWIFATERPLDSQYNTELSAKLQEFIESWTAHKMDVRGSFSIKYQQFIIIAADAESTEVSGCSIDKMFSSITNIVNSLNSKLADVSVVFFKDSEKVQMLDRVEFKKLASDKKINSEQLVFNNTISKLSELNDKWEVAAKDSWHSRYFL